jgi:hypothetical protein
MGASDFQIKAKGKDAKEAFTNAVLQAEYDHGHAGYTGTIAEKTEFEMIPLPKGVNPEEYASNLIDEGDPRIDDKWGPAGCFDLGNGEYLFFGWASC